jgi:hypothetical protein
MLVRLVAKFSFYDFKNSLYEVELIAFAAR